MRRVTLLSVLCAVAFIVSSCCRECKQYQRLRQPLEGTTWQLVQLCGQDIEAEGDSYTLIFSPQGNVSGVGSCNLLMGNFSTTPERDLKIEISGSTRKLCRDNREPKYIETLQRVTHYTMDGPMMLLLSNGSVVALFTSETVQQVAAE